MAHRARCLEDEPGTLHSKSCTPRTTTRRYCATRCTGMRPRLRLTGTVHPARVREEAVGMITRIYGTKCALLE